jgi:O-antigen ligase
MHVESAVIDRNPAASGNTRGLLSGARFEWAIACLAPFVLITYLALSGGGYDLIARSEIGILIWWAVLLGAIAGVIPRVRFVRTTWIATAFLGAFLLWSWLAAGWSQSEERTLAEVARVATYAGTFLICACLVTRGSVRPLLGGIAAAIAVVSGLAVLSRLTPSLFPNDTAAQFYATTRLRYPFDYSDGVGEFAALGLPLLVYFASTARNLLGRGLAAFGLPFVVLCLAMTVSRGGILAAVVGLIAFLALAPDRIPKLLTVALTAVATGVLMGALLNRPGLRDKLYGFAPASQRSSMLAIVIVVAVLMVAAQVGIALLSRRWSRPRWLQFSRRAAQMIAGGLAALVVIAVVVAIASGADHHVWEQFKQPNPPTGNTYLRLLSVAGSHRYQYWQAAVAAFKTAPWKGIGPGTFEFYWAQHNTLSEFVRNAHSLWIETLAEDGIIGLALLAAFFGFVLIGGPRRTVRSGPAIRGELATAVACLFAFCAAAAFDWIWQIGVVPMIAMLLAAVVVSPLSSRGDQDAAEAREPLVRPHAAIRLGLAAAALIALWAIAVPLASTVALRRSQSAAGRDPKAALSDASTAQSLEPGAASPRLQRALLREQLGDVAGASRAIAEAEAREPTNWRIWLVASRIATEADQPSQALAYYRRARALNPTSAIFH